MALAKSSLPVIPTYVKTISNLSKLQQLNVLKHLHNGGYRMVKMFKGYKFLQLDHSTKNFEVESKTSLFLFLHQKIVEKDSWFKKPLNCEQFCTIL